MNRQQKLEIAPKALAMIRLYDAERNHRQTFKADDKLSRATSEILLAIREAEFKTDDIRAYFAPSECLGDIYKALSRSIQTILQTYGFSADDLIAIASERTTSKFVYECGLSYILDLTQ